MGKNPPKTTSEIPTAQEIQDQLVGLNRTQKSWSSSSQSEQARIKAIDNYIKWFTAHNISIHQEKGVWKLRQESIQ